MTRKRTLEWKIYMPISSLVNLRREIMMRPYGWLQNSFCPSQLTPKERELSRDCLSNGMARRAGSFNGTSRQTNPLTVA